METINVNGKKYVLESDMKKAKNLPATRKQIVILNRGWVVVGDYHEDKEFGVIENASVIRVWGTTAGIGELAEKGPLPNTKLDPCPTVRVRKGTEVFRLDVNEEKWEAK